MTAASGAAAAARANQITTGYGGLCLQFVRTCWGVPAKYVNAKTAWAQAKKRHPGLDRIPVGAPLFMSHPKSKDGHVVIYLGGNSVRSTNSATGRVATYSIATWQGWGYTVQGWTEDLNGVDLPIDPTPIAPPPSGPPAAGNVVLNRGDKGVRVSNMQASLNSHFPAYSKLKVDGDFGPATEKVVKEFQRRTGLVQDGIVGPATTSMMNKYGIVF